MDRSGHRHHPDHSSSSSSSSRPTHFRSQKFQTQNAKSSNSDRAAGYSTSDNTRKASSVLPSNSRRVEQDQIEKEEDVSNLPSLVGTCPYMCPERERAQRERLRDLAVFERLYGDPRKSSSSLAVKKFCRTISTKHDQTSDVRPLPVLVNTLDYLLNLLDSTDQSFEVVHDFIFDRTRSIRQDLSMQNIVNDKAIHMYEEMVKFHIISHHKLQNCRSSSNISSAHHLNLEQLVKALTSLHNLYGANRNSNTVYENEAEFQSFHVLLNLGSSSQPKGESLSLWFRDVPSLILKSKEMCFARKILRLFRMGNYKQFLTTTAAEASYLQYCIIEPYINEVRALAVSCINNGGYKLHPYPLAQISRLLMMKESDTESLCTACGLEICMDEIGDKFLPTKQTTLCRPKGGFQNYSFLGLERFERHA